MAELCRAAPQDDRSGAGPAAQGEPAEAGCAPRHQAQAQEQREGTPQQPHAMHSDDLDEQLRRCLNDDRLPLEARIIGALTSLYALPKTRIVELTTVSSGTATTPTSRSRNTPSFYPRGSPSS
ncbi:hypothetical protein [Streptomyces venezuelae]|uniref:hypothetical protein n=1 Tax=Streptomyces venezuelae TaxID=54571 RepID=UPI001CC238A5|nr:hypothetical protein [Streptomyces venezuelae]